MLIQDRNLNHKQLNNPSPACLHTSKITTIAELRQRARLHNRRKSVQYHQRQAQRLKERWEFVRIMHDMLNRIATVFFIDNSLSVEDVYSIFDSHNWYADGHFHSAQTPLSIAFNIPLSFGGQLTIENMRPCFNGLLAGEFFINRDRPDFRPHEGVPPVLLEAA